MIGADPDLHQLLRSVTKGVETLNSKRTASMTGKAQVKFEKVMARIHEHKELLSIVPTEDKYVSAIAGSIALLAKVCLLLLLR